MFEERIEEFWPSIADMMAGLMMIFMFVAVSFMLQTITEKNEFEEKKQVFEKEKERLEEVKERLEREKRWLQLQVDEGGNLGRIIEEYRSTKIDLYNDMKYEFFNEEEEWGVSINSKDATFTFGDPELFFEKGDSDLKPGFKKILNEFFPRYIKILSDPKYKGKIAEIRIEGHTSSEWRRDSDPVESYFNNMALSQKRTRSVLEYVMTIPEMEEYREFLIKTLTANGLSYSKRIIINGKEDKTASRRVEFKIRATSEDSMEKLIQLN